MSTVKSRTHYLETEEGINILEALEQMVADPRYNTAPTYSANSTQYPDNLIPFVDKHMNYLTTHPKVDAEMYIANLKLMTRAR